MINLVNTPIQVSVKPECSYLFLGLVIIIKRLVAVGAADAGVVQVVGVYGALVWVQQLHLWGEEPGGK